MITKDIKDILSSNISIWIKFWYIIKSIFYYFQDKYKCIGFNCDNMNRYLQSHNVSIGGKVIPFRGVYQYHHPNDPWYRDSDIFFNKCGHPAEMEFYEYEEKFIFKPCKECERDKKLSQLLK